MGSEVRLKFLGIRSMHDAPSGTNALYGGNTNCVALEDDEQIFIINAGFGINPYGDKLFKEARARKIPFACHIFLNDFLWDSIMGLPMFTPVHFKSSKISIHSSSDQTKAKELLSSICSRDMSPFAGVDSLSAPLKYPLPEESRTIGKWQITMVTSKHPMAPYPAATWIFEHENGLKIAFCGHRPVDQQAECDLIDKIKGCDVFVQSAVAPKRTHPTMAGRFTFEEAIKFGQQAQAGCTYLVGIHPALNDRDLMKAEVDLHDKYGSQFSIAREWTAVSLAPGGLQRKVG